MPSVTDDVSDQLINKTMEGVRAAPGVLQSTISGGKNIVAGAVNGVVIVFKAPVFTANAVMTAAGKMTHNPKYSKRNISIGELEKNSDIKKMDEGMTREAMKYFDKGCKKYGVTYSAVVDKSNPKDPLYYVFFKGRESSVIEQVMKESYKAYVKEQAKPKVSVKAKLAFFLGRVKARDAEQQDLGKEKHNNRADIQR